MILEGLELLLEDWTDLADFDWHLHEKKRRRSTAGTFIRRNFRILENLTSILEEQEGIVANREHLLEEVRDILEVRKFIRTNKNILELYKIY
ncbi:hypothetical protein [Solibacillus sp. FSL W7-1324]|uniref:hypothetical protein n=1 Tax=Solibacillus sp. FSL W7-1324 TaxID=2921701 RepID=UPI0030F87FA1